MTHLTDNELAILVSRATRIVRAPRPAGCTPAPLAEGPVQAVVLQHLIDRELAKKVPDEQAVLESSFRDEARERLRASERSDTA